MLRLFIAIDLPPEVKAQLRALQASLRPRAPGVRWAAVEGTHLTLVFLGDTPDEQHGAVSEAMRRAAAAGRPLELATAALGAFPKPEQPRVLWLGVAGELDALASLQAAVAGALAPLGFAAEKRPFAPHLTLGRARHDAGTAELRAIAAALRETPTPAPLSFGVRHLALMRSERLPAGARYTVLDQAEL